MLRMLQLKKSFFIVVTGRRRVEKTYIIDELYRDHYCYSLTGIEDGNMQTQIVNFTQKLSEYSNIPIVTTPEN